MLGFHIKLGSSEQNNPLRPRRSSGPYFLSVHQIAIAAQLSFTLDRCEIRAMIGFGITRAPGDFAVQNVRDELALLLFGSVLHDTGAYPRESHHGGAQGRGFS